MTTPAKNRNGILPIPAAATRKGAAPQASGRQPPKAGAPRLRLIIRRLAPGLTEGEFWTALGEEWKVGSNKVDWAAYKPGKVSKDPSKPSQPSRAYLKVKEPALLDELAAKVKQTPFQDAKNTTKDPCLLGPPSLEFALYTRIPGSRVRNDGRQGTIDQDQEFIDFLQSLTEPVGKPTNDATVTDTKEDKVNTTPLVQFLKEKKAAKAKEAVAAKTAKAKEAKEGKSEKSGKTTIVMRNTSTSTEKARVAKATQDAVKAINKSVASMQGKGSSQKNESKASTAATASKDTATPTTKPPRERRSAAVANRILQQDLGLAPKETKASRAARASAAAKESDATPKTTPTAANTSSTSPAKSTTTAASAATPVPPTGPRNSRPPSVAAAKPNVVPPARPTKPAPQPTSGAKSAFLKHANASQGVTEELLRVAFEGFGALTKCEIDKKKGFGYVDFADADGLKKAMQASPVKVGNGQVVVLENKTRRIVPPAPVPASPTAAVVPPSPTKATPATAVAITNSLTVETNANIPPVSSPTTAAPSQPAPPRAPRGAARGGPGFNRGRGGFVSGRANFQAPRGAARGNFRGGRGNNRSGSNASNVSNASPGVTNAASKAPPATPVTESGAEKS